jgi:putative tryptophan/tyrosine transport system substrate-binding protein
MRSSDAAAGVDHIRRCGCLADRKPNSQDARKTYRLGILTLTERAMEETRQITLAELANRGFIEGRNLIVEPYIGGPDQLSIGAQVLVAGKPDVIYAIGTAAVKAVKDATSSIPIVMFGDDPIAQGFAESLARPGGNITGVTLWATELNAKRLQLLHQAVPAARRLAALLRSLAPNHEATKNALRQVTASAGLELIVLDVAESTEYRAAFDHMRVASAQALAITSNPQLYRDAEQLASLALEFRLPTICDWAEMARAGCLIGYGPRMPELRGLAADYISRIFQGALPNTLPVEGPTHFTFALNLRTARALGIEVSQGLLLRADEVIE